MNFHRRGITRNSFLKRKKDLSWLILFECTGRIDIVSQTLNHWVKYYHIVKLYSSKYLMWKPERNQRYQILKLFNKSVRRFIIIFWKNWPTQSIASRKSDGWDKICDNELSLQVKPTTFLVFMVYAWFVYKGILDD